LLPFIVNAKYKDVVAPIVGIDASEKVTLYLFHGDGCPHCEDEFRFFESIKTEYGDYFVLNKFEVWHNEENKKLLKQFANSVTLLTNGLEFNLDDNVNLNLRKIKEIKGNEVVEEIVFEDDSTLKISGLFVAVGVASSLDFARKLGAEIQNNKLVVNELMQTNLPGLYACGDAVKGTPQIAKAVYEGMVAGMEASKYVRNLK
jgi:pyruvate/2-oxoglutarate dehydrogenase complex dihydrolipoamide dehydrogenase (E3) component